LRSYSILPCLIEMRGGERPFSGFYTILYLAFDKSGLL